MYRLALGLSLVVAMSACIEGEDPNSCGLDEQCGAGRACSVMRRCEAIDRLQDVTVLWTIDGASPTPASCAGQSSMRVGVEGPGWGVGDVVECSAGTELLRHVPIDFTTVSAYMYQTDAGGNPVVWRTAVAGRDRVVDGAVTLQFGP